MAFDPVPWFVGGGAEHSPEVGRLLAYNAARGNEGILGSTDLEVRALNIPGAGVRVGPGACNILNRTPGYKYDMYMGRLASEDTVNIAAASSGTARSDMVVAIIKDPTLAGSPWNAPADVKNGPYIFLDVISDVGNTATTVADTGLGYSAIPLARIDIPAGVGTIEQTMIKDLRFMANPRRKRILNAHALVSGEGGALNSTDSTNGAYWPPSVGRWFVPVPEWATRMQIVATLGGIQIPAGSNAFGSLWVQIGTNDDANTYETQRTAYDAASVPNNQRNAFFVIDDVAVHSVIRGTTASIGIRGYKASSQSGTGITADGNSSVAIDIEFLEQPEATFQT